MSFFYILWALLVVTAYSYTVDVFRVTRRLDGPDLLTNLGPANSRCEDMKGECHNFGCSMCICNKNTPTFVAQWKKCVKDKDVRQLFYSSQNNWSVGYSCSPKELPSINISATGKKKLKGLVICRGNKYRTELRGYENINCDVARVKYLVQHQNGSFGEEEQFVDNRQMFKLKFMKKNGKKSPVFEWDTFDTTHPFVGAILSINFNCTKRKKKNAQFIIKISGEKQWNFSSIVVHATDVEPTKTSPVIQPTSVTTRSITNATQYVAADTLPTVTRQRTSVTTRSITNATQSVAADVLPTVTRQPTARFTVKVTTSAVIITQSPTTSRKEGQKAGGRKQEPHTEVKEANTVTITLSILGTLVLVISICLSAVLLTKRRRKSRERNTAKETAESYQTNPTYDRGVDLTVLNGELNAAYKEEDSTYQPIVQNARATSDQPTYETLQRHKQNNPGEDPSIYQALDTSKCPEFIQESHYQPLFKESRNSLGLKNNGSREDDTEGEYAVLEDPSEDMDEAEGPIYQVLEQGEGKWYPQESTMPNEPIYDVLEAE